MRCRQRQRSISHLEKVKLNTGLYVMVSVLCITPSSYCSTITGTSPHFPAVYASPPSTAIASASPRCRTIKKNQRQTPQNGAKRVSNKTQVLYFHPRVFYHNLFQAPINCGSIRTSHDGATLSHAVDDPCVTLLCLCGAHSTPSEGRG